MKYYLCVLYNLLFLNERLPAIFVGFVGMLAYANLPSAWILPQKSASEPYLASAKLQTIPSGLGGIPVGLFFESSSI